MAQSKLLQLPRVFSKKLDKMLMTMCLRGGVRSLPAGWGGQGGVGVRADTGLSHGAEH